MSVQTEIARLAGAKTSLKTAIENKGIVVADEDTLDAYPEYVNQIIGEPGEDGGYYQPAVDAAGNLTWAASKSGMPDIAAANIKGPQGPAGADGAPGAKGEDGDSGVYYGSTQPTDGSTVWIDPSGEADAISEATTTSISGLLKGDSGVIAPAVAGTDYAAPVVDTTATLATTWTGSAAPYTQTVSIAGMTATAKIEVGLASTITAEQYAAAAAGQLMCTAQAAGSITMTAYGEKPTMAIPILVRVVG